jgi:hypothetical protein
VALDSAPKPMSLRAYARRRGVSPEAVSKAVADGRLRESVTRAGGAPKIADPDLADREWDTNTQPRADQVALPGTQSNGAADYHTSRAIREAAAARRETAQAELAELELAERRGQLVDAEQARADVIAAFSLVKTRLLAVPSRLGQRLPDVAADVVPVVDELIREALEELAGGDGSAGE